MATQLLQSEEEDQSQPGEEPRGRIFTWFTRRCLLCRRIWRPLVLRQGEIAARVEILFFQFAGLLLSNRIALRILMLRFRSRPRVARDWFMRHLPRPFLLLVVGLAGPVIASWLLALRYPVETHGAAVAMQNLMIGTTDTKPEWREVVQIILLAIGVPSAFLLWLFRDIHINSTLDNQRKDVNLKEFQEIQMRVAGALAETLPERSRETLQIAALHQLRTFLRGEYGKSFQRPAFELLRARLVTSAELTGTSAIADWITGWPHDPAAPMPVADMKQEVASALGRLRACRVASAEQALLTEECRTIFRTDRRLSGSCFDRLVLPRGAMLSGLDLSRCRFVGATLEEVHLERASLGFALFAGSRLRAARLEGAVLDDARLESASLVAAHLEGARLHRAQLQGADLSYANLVAAQFSTGAFRGRARRPGNQADMQGATLSRANLTGVDLYRVNLEKADIRHARLVRADLTEARLDGADLGGAILNGATLTGIDPTMLASCRGAAINWETRLTAVQGFTTRHALREYLVARRAWIECGAIYTDRYGRIIDAAFYRRHRRTRPAPVAPPPAPPVTRRRRSKVVPDQRAA